MSYSKPILVAKTIVLLGFLSLVVCTYYLRSEVLALSHIKFSADEVRAANDLKQLRESFPDRVKQHEAAMKHYELQTEHYRKMLDLYQSNYDEYVKRIEDKYHLPTLPGTPMKPDPPEVAEKLFEINTDFRIRKNQYFATSSRLNWLACIAALMLVGGLVYLLMFDVNGQRWHYLVALVISFVFLIGPAFHSIMTGIIGFLKDRRFTDVRTKVLSSGTSSAQFPPDACGEWLAGETKGTQLFLAWFGFRHSEFRPPHFPLHLPPYFRGGHFCGLNFRRISLQWLTAMKYCAVSIFDNLARKSCWLQAASHWAMRVGPAPRLLTLDP